MSLKKIILLLVSHATVGVAGVVLGIYLLPILIAPAAPSDSDIKALSSNAQYSGQFKRDLTDSDFLHWGEGRVSVSPTMISLIGKLAPGPDYQLYLSPKFIETEADFKRLKPRMRRVGTVKTFDNFLLQLPADIDISQFNTVIIWCESFGEFITAAQYR